MGYKVDKCKLKFYWLIIMLHQYFHVIINTLINRLNYWEHINNKTIKQEQNNNKSISETLMCQEYVFKGFALYTKDLMYWIKC